MSSASGSRSVPVPAATWTVQTPLQALPSSPMVASPTLLASPKGTPLRDRPAAILLSPRQVRHPLGVQQTCQSSSSVSIPSVRVQPSKLQRYETKVAQAIVRRDVAVKQCSPIKRLVSKPASTPSKAQPIPNGSEQHAGRIEVVRHAPFPQGFGLGSPRCAKLCQAASVQRSRSAGGIGQMTTQQAVTSRKTHCPPLREISPIRTADEQHHAHVVKCASALRITSPRAHPAFASSDKLSHMAKVLSADLSCLLKTPDVVQLPSDTCPAHSHMAPSKPSCRRVNSSPVGVIPSPAGVIRSSHEDKRPTLGQNVAPTRPVLSAANHNDTTVRMVPERCCDEKQHDVQTGHEIDNLREALAHTEDMMSAFSEELIQPVQVLSRARQVMCALHEELVQRQFGEFDKEESQHVKSPPVEIPSNQEHKDIEHGNGAQDISIECSACRYEVELDKTDGSKLGMTLRSHDGATMVIDEIAQGGLVDLWNTKNLHKQVNVGHSILEVNGIPESSQMMLDECKASKVLHIVLGNLRVMDSNPSSAADICQSLQERGRQDTQSIPQSVSEDKRLCGEVPRVHTGLTCHQISDASDQSSHQDHDKEDHEGATTNSWSVCVHNSGSPLVSAWSNICHTRLPRGSQRHHCAQAVVEYSKLLMSKMELMLERDAGRGRFDGSLVFHGQLGEPSDLLQALAMLLNFAEKLIPLSSHLVSSSQDWRRLEETQYMRLYIGGILALLHEAWLLLCSISLFVKHLLCLVHLQKQREDRQSRRIETGEPPWLQLASHLLAAQPRFIWFHQSICELTAHCHQLRVAGFHDIAPSIPSVPSSLLNLFADLGELVKSKPSAKEKARRAPESISNASTTTGSTVLPPEEIGQATSNSWEPSALVIDALRTVDSIQRSALAAAHDGNLEHETEQIASSGSEKKCESEAGGGGSLVERATPFSRLKLSKNSRQYSMHPFAQGYALLDDDSEYNSTRSTAATSALPPSDAAAACAPAKEFCTIRDEQAPFVPTEESKSPLPFTWPVPTASPSWTPCFDLVEAPSGATATSPSEVNFPAPPASDRFSGVDAPPSWASAICRSNVGNQRPVVETSPTAVPLFRGPPWHAPASSDLSAVQAAGSASFPIEKPSATRRSLSADTSDVSPSERTREAAENIQGPSRRKSGATPPGTSLNPFEPMIRAKAASGSAFRGESHERVARQQHLSYVPPPVSVAESASPSGGAFHGNGGEAWSRNTNSGSTPTVSGKHAAVAVPLRIDLPGVKSRAANHPAKNGSGTPSQAANGPRSLRPAQGKPISDTSPPSNNSDLGAAFGGAGGTPRERRESSKDAHRSPRVKPRVTGGVSPTMPVRMVSGRQPAAEDVQHGVGVIKKQGKESPRTPCAAASNSVALQPGISTADWEVNPSELQLEEMVGSGTTAEVYRGSWHGTDVAVKKLRQSGPLSTEFTRELSVLLRLRHPNLVLFMGASLQAPPMIISEFCSGGTVFTLLHQRPNQGIPWGQRLKVAVDVAKGMNFLHRRQVVHRDLKSLNLLLASRVASAEDVPAIKISDFGLSRISANDNKDQKMQACMTSGAGTYHWMAPEVLDGHKYDEKVDVYSYGICLFELIARRIPYDGSGLEPVSIAVAVSKGTRPDISCVPQNCPADLRFTMECCWAHSPTGRPGFDTILETLKLVHCA